MTTNVIYATGRRTLSDILFWTLPHIHHPLLVVPTRARSPLHNSPLATSYSWRRISACPPISSSFERPTLQALASSVLTSWTERPIGNSESLYPPARSYQTTKSYFHLMPKSMVSCTARPWFLFVTLYCSRRTNQGYPYLYWYLHD